nr:LOW QUALITY PROTEIN: glutamate receptor-like [Cherax quadricarinatus]
MKALMVLKRADMERSPLEVPGVVWQEIQQNNLENESISQKACATVTRWKHMISVISFGKHQHNSYRIFARPPELSAVSWTSYTRPFSSALWLCLLLVLALLAIVFWGVSHCYFHKLSTNPTRGSRKEAMKYQEWKREFLLLTWAAITQQGWPNSPDAGVLRILFWMMYVIGLVVMAAYSATLVSFLTVVNDQLPFDTLEDLKQLQKYRLGIQKGSMLEEFFKNQNFLVYYKALIEPYTDTLKKSIIELRTLALKNSDYAYVGSYEVQRLDSVGACIFKSAHRHLLFKDGALAWLRGSPYLQLFDHL